MIGPAQTLDFMIAGYGVIIGTILFYIGSLMIRWRKLRHDQQYFDKLVGEKKG